MSNAEDKNNLNSAGGANLTAQPEVKKKGPVGRALRSKLGRLLTTLTSVFLVYQVLEAFGIKLQDYGLTLWLLGSLVLNFWLALEWFILRDERPPGESEPRVNPNSPEGFGTAVVAYATSLLHDSKFTAIMALCDNTSRTLHLMGLQKYRVSLGEIALQATIKSGNDEARARILVDELGWARYLTGSKKEAVASIEAGIRIAAGLNEPEASAFRRVCAAQIQAKGLRHLAIIAEDRTSSKSIQEGQQLLACALEIARSDSALQSKITDLEIDLAQLSHANSVLVAKKYNLLEKGQVSKQINRQKRDIEDALSSVLSAGQVFEKVGDMERYAKTLNLSIRLQEALGRSIEAQQTQIKRDHVIANSGVSDPAKYLRI